MIGRPLSPLRKTTFSVPAPGAVSFFVSHLTRNPPVSLVKFWLWRLPWPDHDPTSRQTTTSRGGGGALCWRQPPSASAARMIPARVVTPRNLIYRVLAEVMAQG